MFEWKVSMRPLHGVNASALDREHWLSRPAADRLEAVEFLRRQVYGDYPEGLQRVYRIIERSRS